MKKKTAIIVAMVIVLLVLLFPIREIYKDGGTKTYTALTYKVIVWNTLDGKTGTEVHFFPFNFYGLEHYNK